MLQLKNFSILAYYNQSILSFFTAHTTREFVCFCFIFRIEGKKKQTILFQIIWQPEGAGNSVEDLSFFYHDLFIRYSHMPSKLFY